MANINIFSTNTKIKSAEVNTNFNYLETVVNEGWVNPDETWTYLSATTITVPTDATTKYNIGDKIKITQTTVKYFYIVGVTATILTVTAGSDYTVANAAITEPFYSKVETPQGFDAPFNWVPTLVGWSANPATNVYRFSLSGRKCILHIRQAADGTSNAQSITFTLPITAVTKANHVWGGSAMAKDNGVNLGTPSLWLITSADTIVTFYKDYATSVWTAAGAKRITASTVEYEI